MIKDYTPEEAFNELCKYFIGSDDIIDQKYNNIGHYRIRVELIKNITKDGFLIPLKIARIASISSIVLSIICIILAIFIICT